MFFSGRNIDGTREGGGNLGEILECEASANKLLVRLELSSALAYYLLSFTNIHLHSVPVP